MNQTTLNIALSVDHEYVPYAYVMLTSLLSNNPLPVNIYVLHTDLADSDKNIFHELTALFSVDFHYITVPDTCINTIQHTWPDVAHPETYFYQFIPQLLTGEVDRILYLDADIIVNGAITDLYTCDLQERPLALCGDSSALLDGLILFDFRYMNSSVTELLNQHSTTEIHYLDPMQYNLSARQAYTNLNLHYKDVKQNALIIHYTGEKPWRGNCFHCDIEWIWWEYAKNTPFYQDLMQDTMYEITTDNTLRTYITNVQLEHRQLLDIVDKYELLLKKSGIPF